MTRWFGRPWPLAAASLAIALTTVSAQTSRVPEQARLYVTDVAPAIVSEGLAMPAPTRADASGFQIVPSPGIRNVQNVAQATTAPWIDSNAWRFQRGLTKANYAKLSPGFAGLAAAEAFAFDVEAILNPEPGDVPELTSLLRFLKGQTRPPLPALVNIGIVDDRSPAMDEVLNMLSRRNLLYRVVPAPDRKLDLTVQVGTADFPREVTANPSDFAARVREKLGDDKRLVRLYGTSSVLARLTGDGRNARLFLLNFGRSRNQQNQQNVRVRVLGRYTPEKLAAYGAPPEAALADVQNPGRATEFLLPAFSTIAIVDLKGQ
jgi:hypothetical protein